MRRARQGHQVQLIVAGKSDVALSQLAGQRLYTPLLRSGIEIYEYEPQILHAKLFIFADVVYAGSANLDTRSLNINYELLVRIANPTVAAEAQEIFQGALQHSVRIHLEAWRRSRTLWRRIKERWAYFVLARVDTYWARQHLKYLR